MQFRSWRIGKQLSIADAARGVGIEGVNPAGTLIRIEQGKRQPDADMVERIVAFTAGAVTAADMHETRLAWLKTNRPEKFSLEGACRTSPAGSDPSDPAFSSEAAA